jgi:hypothetical protein
MKQALEIKLTPGGIVWIRGRECITGQYVDGLWEFASKDGKWCPKLSPPAIRKLINDDCFFSEPMRKALSPNVREALNTDWGAFTLAEQMSAERKLPFVQAIDELHRQMVAHDRRLSHFLRATVLAHRDGRAAAGLIQEGKIPRIHGRQISF